MPVFLQYCTMGATEAEAKCLPIRSRSNILINNSTCSMHGPEKMREKVRIPKVTMISLGVSDLAKATAFYGQVLETAPNTSSSAITFIKLPGTWLALYPLEKLAEDISPHISPGHDGFSGITLAYNARSKEEVLAIMQRAQAAGAKVAKEPVATFWGGFSGYFADLDGYYWEVAWGPMFVFTEHGNMNWKETS